jgi:hypothetical protein
MLVSFAMLYCAFEKLGERKNQSFGRNTVGSLTTVRVHTVHYISEVSCNKNSGVPQAPYNPASLIGHFPVSVDESLFKSMWKCKKKVEHVDQIPSNNVWNCGKT